ncbi:hypothetical protein QN277_013073 [Acacia crassicarpa]|uniref:Uncharacterized protein n=1 Tax=Acacia crassicarpa TaxID=499986 RepID=A0AAE1N2H1_9FABA|nr:hypothetical protein QN277_013073 [Acacia crassicarpa]
MQAIVSMPFDLSSADFSTKPGTCFREQVGVKAPGTAKKTAFLPLVSSETVTVLTSSAASRKEKVASGSLSPTEMVAEMVDLVVKEAESGREIGRRWLNLRDVGVIENLEERAEGNALEGRRHVVAVAEAVVERSLENVVLAAMRILRTDFWERSESCGMMSEERLKRRHL